MEPFPQQPQRFTLRVAYNSQDQVDQVVLEKHRWVDYQWDCEFIQVIPGPDPLEQWLSEMIRNLRDVTGPGVFPF